MKTKLEFGKEMQGRTKMFAIDTIKFFGKLPKTEEARVIGRQLLRAATSVAANYRAACRAKSNADFIHKLGTVVEETDECLLWLELMDEGTVCPGLSTATLKAEADELLRILQTSLSTARLNATR